MRPRSASDSMQHTKTLKERSKLNENNVVIPFEKWMTYRKPRTKCFLIIQLLKLIAAILVPLMIGAFKVIQTIHDSRNLQLDRDAEYQRRMDDKLNIDIERQHGDIRATELRIQQIYDKFLSETQETLRKSTEDLTEADLIFLRARTWTTIEQVDPKRKVYLIELLYDSRLLYVSEYVGNMNYRSVDLEGVDLSNCEFGRSNRGDTMKMMNLNGIRLSRAFLRNSSFKHVNLTGSTFEHCDLTGTNFTDVSLTDVNFNDAIVDHSNFIDVLFKTKRNNRSMFRSVMFTGSEVSTYNDTWYDCNFSGSTFIQTLFPQLKIKNSFFDRTRFVNIGFVNQVLVSNVQIRNSSFENIRSTAVFYTTTINNRSDLSGTLFHHLLLREILLDDVDMKRCDIFNVTVQRLAKFNRVNMRESKIDLINYQKELFIINSILPNGSLVTSFEFRRNLLRNGDAEEKRNESRLNQTIIPGWQRRGVLQWLYNMIGSEIAHDNHGGRCLFFGGERYTSLFHNAIEQVIDVSRFVRLFDSYETKFTVRADLGGINNTEDTASIDIWFKSGTSYISNVQIGKFR
ncbi:unnamed protein product [Rotaria sordida]|uniref:Pentapeptide repeat-containing protein n=1 Tax=Rotaria sordida TaxID=392033 RepID=A0A819B9N5_9BILA|nr:unnamed protein product [Rotaria sordida]